MAITKEQATQMMWASANLWPKLDANQQGMYWAYRKSTYPKFVFDVARRVGKSTTMVLSALETCLRRPRAIVKYGVATQEMAKEIILPLVEWVCEDAPKQFRPRWSPTESVYIFGNGSRMKLVGLDLHPDRLRGTALDEGYIDEAGFVKELEYVVQSILVPQMQGRPWAKLLLGSTPPPTPAHKWTTRYVPEAKANGAYIFRTIADNPRLSEKEKAFFVQEAGGPESTENLRENYAQHIVDDELAVVPEFHREEQHIVVDRQRPEHFDSYVSMDPGFTDLTFVCFAYYDFADNKIVVEDELSLAKSNTNQIAAAIVKKEKELWGNLRLQSGKPHPHLRVSDVDPRLLSDMWSQHKMMFVPTQKDDKNSAINALRNAVQQHRLVILPKCKATVAHLKHAIWNRYRTSFERSGDYGHFDAVDALVYLVRNIHKGRNPNPTFGPGVTMHSHIIHPATSQSKEADELKKLFKRSWAH